MRFSGVPAIVFACVALSGCASKSLTVEDVLAQTSLETTGAIISSAEAGQPELLAMAPSVPIPDAIVSAEAGEAHEAHVTQAAFVVPPRPSQKPAVRGSIYPHRFRDAHPINFGSASPKSLPVHGVDVSRWQGEIDWAGLRAHGANFVFIKATDGGDHVDPLFRKNWNTAAAAGLKRGAYHFFYWCRTGAEQADWFIRNVPKVEGALPPVLDVEWNSQSSCKRRPSRAQVLEKMQVFLDKLERHYGQRPIIYTAPDFYRDNLRGEFLEYPFWLRSVAAHPSQVYPGRKWVFWQYSGTGLSHGVKGKLDLNAFHGSENDWHNWVAANTR